MDWIDEKIGQIRHRIQDLSVKWALAAYLLLAFFAAFVCSWLIQQLCISRCNEILYPYGVDVYRERIAGNIYYSGTEAAMYLLSDGERVEIRLLQLLSNAAPWILTGCGAVCAAVLFYRMRLRRPCEILKNGVAEMGRKNLDFEISYDSRDEMGELCRTFERMRREVVADREELWRRIEDQKEINAAFAHDMRTPLTVLRGYTELLYRYAPEGKISEEKLLSTLKLMSEHLKRLKEYTKTMRQIRSFEEIEPQREKVGLGELRARVAEISEPLNAVGDIQILCGEGKDMHGDQKDTAEDSLWLDGSLFLEVLENLLSNALRYAKSRVEITLDHKRETEMLFLYVHDDGPGFDEKERKSVTEPYFRGSREAAADGGGQGSGYGNGYESRHENGYGIGYKSGHFGIGLHICRVIAERHGGVLNVANGMDGGAFVSVSFFCGKS